ncbi:MAG: hypothetical protein DRN28_07255 [Thermoplasmata archaeon]|nr:MAG: hypothetical protein DRN28_07255 [Thermoplasmata archaeon]
MKLVFGSISELIDELKERKVEVVRVAAVAKDNASSSSPVVRRNFFLFVTAELGGSFAEVRIPLGSCELLLGRDGEMRKLLERAREKAEAVKKRLKEEGFTIRPGAWMEGEVVNGTER